jgi:hypothetical protein
MKWENENPIVYMNYRQHLLLIFILKINTDLLLNKNILKNWITLWTLVKYNIFKKYLSSLDSQEEQIIKINETKKHDKILIEY